MPTEFKLIASVLAFVPAFFLVRLFVEEPEAVFLPVLTLIYAAPPLLGWPHPKLAALLLLCVGVLGGRSHRGGEPSSLYPLLGFAILPCASALALLAGRLLTPDWPVVERGRMR